MNILFLSNIVTPYQLDLLEEINSLNDINIYGYFLFSKENNRNWTLTMPNYVNVINYSKSIKDYISIYNFIKERNIEKIIIGGYSLPMSIYLTLLTKTKHIDLYFWLERPINAKVGIKKYLKELYLRCILSQANKIFAIGKLAVERYSIYNKNIINLPYSMNLDAFYNIKRDNSDKNKISFLFSGQYIDRKNILNTIKAFKSIENNNIELNLIGGGELQSNVSSIIKEDKRIHDLGFIQPQNLLQVYSKNDIFLMPSKHDGWALVINEAMASSMPIISTDKVGAVVEYIEHKRNGYITDTDVNSIRGGILYYANNKDFIIQHGISNKNIIKKSKADVKNSVKFLIKELDKQ